MILQKIDFIKRFAAGLLKIIVTLAIWDATVIVFRIPNEILPRAWDVMQVIIAQLPLFLEHVSYSLFATVIGFLIAAFSGIVLALTFEYVQLLRKLFYPALISFQSIPKIALAPIIVIWFGYGIMPKIIMSALISFFPVFINTIVGFKSVEEEMTIYARLLNMNWWQKITKIQLPASAGNIMGGLKIAITFSLIGTIIGEFAQPDTGLGYLISVGKEDFKTTFQFAAVALVSFMGWLLYQSIVIIEKTFFSKYTRYSTIDIQLRYE